MVPLLMLSIASACAERQAAPAAPLSPAAATSSPLAVAPGTACNKKPTVAQTEGPYFKSGSPQRVNLLDAGMAGTPLLLTGHVLNDRCAPVPSAVLDFWQADASGAYDNSGYRLRGHQATAADGAYRLDTIIPGLYPGRTEHIHVKVTPSGGGTLTTQLYFPGVPRNQEDGIFDPSLVVGLANAISGKAATYDFILSQG